MPGLDKEIYVAIIGAGGVGSKFLEQFAYLTKHRPSLHLRLCYVAIIDKGLCHRDYSPIEFDTALETLESTGFEPPQIPQIVGYLSASPGKVIVADNTRSQAIASAYPLFLRSGISIVTPNKKAFSESYKL
ncbi:hypothetical protein BFJ68_g15560 [Fusarium oxysporum]|uniref:Aspartate/homoserine dehydrogenase NAD-binding domain-containing protein n=1 Tax=Fusarium oxysporum TaxID=5507 RepID=A0A420PLP1_FUSOX|nr:hypothetical protein BFJ68_g15560 [Fusarium oxysporum]